MEEGGSCQSGHCYWQINSFHQPLACPPEGPKSSTKTRWKGDTLLPVLRAVWLLYSPSQEGWICLPLNSVLTARPRGALASKSPSSLGCPASPVMSPLPRDPARKTWAVPSMCRGKEKSPRELKVLQKIGRCLLGGGGEYNRPQSSLFTNGAQRQVMVGV